ncbi:hypothetical protein Mmc1_1902 [Magnetococcus marinus MC-1]|uniref:Uncharacterized protein n=1 Tax=Magnetococcus marinus (strain ATCC BAA-1437 / JCM 17883 / MC-1) TaxID=156889 RepID=A0L8W7_MAGMM|nr:hypothetical protein [Magnetococcus marinus]ABK44410.1 hypothetical protein Mmc1_1902 [Magnetococcus marinus MC-1]
MLMIYSASDLMQMILTYTVNGADSIPVSTLARVGAWRGSLFCKRCARGASAVLAAAIFHYQQHSIDEAKKHMKGSGGQIVALVFLLLPPKTNGEGAPGFWYGGIFLPYTNLHTYQNIR